MSEPAAPSIAALRQAQQTTLAALVEIDEQALLQLTRLTLPEIRALREEVARIVPAGNLPAFILSGLIQLKGRQVNPDRMQQDLNALLRGLSLLPYGVFVAGPAAALYAYQKILQLAGKELTTAFPQGIWQFYLEFGLREDAARHANETTGFHAALPAQADLARMGAAWVNAMIELLYRYDALLATEWRERVLLRLILEAAQEGGLADQPPFLTLITDWSRRRPYHRRTPESDYLAHRQLLFQHFVEERLGILPTELRAAVHQRFAEREATELAAYQDQMTLLATLRPERFQEQKEPFPLWQAAIGFIWQGHTYLLPVCARDAQGSPLCAPMTSGQPPFPLYTLPDGMLCDARRQPLTVDRQGQVRTVNGGTLLGRLLPTAPDTVLAWVSTILAAPAPTTLPTLDLLLAESPRQQQGTLRGKLPKATRAELAALRHVPIFINWDIHAAALPLAVIRRDHRGVGDHALTLFRTERSIVFDQSHIFFDGTWGMAVAEIATDSAIHAYRQLSQLTPASSAPHPPVLKLESRPEVETLARTFSQQIEVDAESEALNMAQLQRLRRWLEQRGVRLTVNDLLILYRCFHAVEYSPAPPLAQAIAALPPALRDLVASTHARFQTTNPALLIPMDASGIAPRERLYPTTFRNPLTELPALFRTTEAQYRACRENPTAPAWEAFDRSRRELLAYLKTFGELLDALKAVTMRGESFNTATLRLLGHLPVSMQHLLDTIPQRITVLNEIIKGNEVFSNVGRVAPGSTLRRFISAKDDGQTKELVWGFLTDDHEVMHLSLRDFRAYVGPLVQAGQAALAQALVQDYLESYVAGFNRFVDELSKIAGRQKPPHLNEKR